MSYTVIAKCNKNTSGSLTTINCSTSPNHKTNPQTTLNNTFNNKSSSRQNFESNERLIEVKPSTTQNDAESNISCSFGKVKNQSYTVIKADKSNKDEEEREMANKQLTNSKSQCLYIFSIVEENKSYLIYKDVKVDSNFLNSDEDEEEREMANKQLNNSKSQCFHICSVVEENKSYTIYNDVKVDTNFLNKPKVDLPETKTHAGGKVEENISNMKISNKSYTVIKRGETTDLNNSKKANNGPDTLNEVEVNLTETKTCAGDKFEENISNMKISNKSYTIIKTGEITNINNFQKANDGPGMLKKEIKHSEKELKCKDSSEIRNCFFIYQAHRLNENPMNKSNQRIKGIRRLKEFQNVQAPLHNYNIAHCTGSNKFVKRELEQISEYKSIIEDKGQIANRLPVLSKNNYSNSHKELRPFKTNWSTIYKGVTIKSNQSAIRNWQKLQFNNFKVQQYILQNNPRTAVEKTMGIKRKPCILENSSSEYHKTKCNINIPKAQFATIIPLLVQNDILWYYEATQ